MTTFFQPTFLIGMPGGTELILILVVILLFFGGKKIPSLLGGIGRGIREYKNEKNGLNDNSIQPK